MALSVGVAPLGLGCALLSYLIALEIHRSFAPLNPERSISELLPIRQIEHTLAAVRSSMVELPGDDARAIAHFVTTNRMTWLENRQLTSLVHKLETQYEALVIRFEGHLARQRENVAGAPSEPGRLRDKQDAIAAQVGTLMIDRDFTAWPKEPWGRRGHPPSKPSESGLAVDEQRGNASILANNLGTKTEARRSWISNTRVFSEPSARFAALRIARRLDDIRRKALRSKLEQIFTIDVGTRLLEEFPGNRLLQLDAALELRLLPAGTEVIDERNGRIRFFPDGSSTGGSIQVQHEKEGATVNVDRSTGVVTVDVNGD
jgi:general secretion pathway protein H